VSGQGEISREDLYLLVGRYFWRKMQMMERREGKRETDYNGHALNLDGKMYNVGETDCG
jgi:hypothetical protein